MESRNGIIKSKDELNKKKSKIEPKLNVIVHYIGEGFNPLDLSKSKDFGFKT